MTQCCAPSRSVQGTDKFFSRQARRYKKQFVKRGLAKEQRLLAEGIGLSPLAGKSILEIGCGVGGLHLTLLQRGAQSALGIDVSEGMLREARGVATDLHLEEKAAYRLGDFVGMSDSVGEADIAVLDKVVCCYENLDELLARSLSRARSTYAVSFPRPNAFIHLLFSIPIFIGRILRWSFHPYWHDWIAMTSRIEREGFRQIFRKQTFFWDVCVFERVA
jgi:magnesium-protoporphyrin O-methyltransferase